MYALLLHPGHNRVFFDRSKALSLAELEISIKSAENSSLKEICGTSYITFDAEMNDRVLTKLANLSSYMALFEIVDEGLLKPIAFPSKSALPDGLRSMLKYAGKTNENFTRMLINVAVGASDFSSDTKLCMLDPLSGKGTSLFEGLLMGMDVTGIEIGTKVVNEAALFFKRFLEAEKVKHRIKKDRVKTDAGLTDLIHYSYALEKDDFKREENLQRCTFAAGNSKHAHQMLKKNAFHVITADLPYGVQHSAVTAEKQSSFTRNPEALLRGCVPSWLELLKKGGAIAVSYNQNIIAKEKIDEIFTSNGLTVMGDEPYNSFEHRVDQAIVRNVSVGKKQ